MLWDEPGGCLFIGLVVSGVKVARARLRLRCGTWELLALGWGEGGGLSRSSDEAPVMGVERRGWVARVQFDDQPAVGWEESDE
jgi:hypothetical protein